MFTDLPEGWLSHSQRPFLCPTALLQRECWGPCLHLCWATVGAAFSKGLSSGVRVGQGWGGRLPLGVCALPMGGRTPQIQGLLS